MISQFGEGDFIKICNQLSKKDKDLKKIIRLYGHPPMWARPATFQTLVLIILEQQVSLASAYAAFKKLKQKIGYISAIKILSMTGAELKACYFSRQKIIYAKELAKAIVSRQLDLKKLSLLSDDEIRIELKKIKGIGDWSADVYMMHSLQRADLFPLGDIALVNSLKDTKQLHPQVTKEEMLALAASWRPYRTIAAMMLWHAYIQKRRIKVLV